MEPSNGRTDLRERPISELVSQFSEQTSALVRQELRLAQLELQEKGKRGGIGAGLFGAAGLVGLFALGTIVATAVMLLATAVDAWLAGLIVAAALGVVAGALALGGKKEIQQATPPAPEQAIENVRQDVEVVKERARR